MGDFEALQAWLAWRVWGIRRIHQEKERLGESFPEGSRFFGQNLCP